MLLATVQIPGRFSALNKYLSQSGKVLQIGWGDHTLPVQQNAIHPMSEKNTWVNTIFQMTNQDEISLNSCKISICILRQVCGRATAYDTSETYSGRMQRVLATVLQKMNSDHEKCKDGS